MHKWYNSESNQEDLGNSGKGVISSRKLMDRKPSWPPPIIDEMSPDKLAMNHLEKASEQETSGFPMRGSYIL